MMTFRFKFEWFKSIKYPVIYPEPLRIEKRFRNFKNQMTANHQNIISSVLAEQLANQLFAEACEMLFVVGYLNAAKLIFDELIEPQYWQDHNFENNQEFYNFIHSFLKEGN